MCQKECKWEAIHIKMSSANNFFFHVNQTCFHNKGFVQETRFETEAETNGGNCLVNETNEYKHE